MVGSQSGGTTRHGRQLEWGPWSTVGVRTICHGRQSEWETTRHGDTPWSAVGVGTMVDSRSEDDMSWLADGVGATRHGRQSE